MPPLPPLLAATLIKRHKRFLADVTLEGGEELTAHCANPGSMRGLTDEGSGAWLSDSYNPRDPKTHKRKLRYSLELIALHATPARPAALVCVNTLRANGVARAGVEAGAVPALRGLTLRPEAPWRGGEEEARLDFALYPPAPHASPTPIGYLEVKSATLSLAPHEASFPDAVTERGQRHLRALMEIKRAGLRAALLFVVMRTDARSFRPAHEIDPRYAALLREARDAGVEIYAHACDISTTEMTLSGALPIVWDHLPEPPEPPEPSKPT